MVYRNAGKNGYQDLFKKTDYEVKALLEGLIAIQGKDVAEHKENYFEQYKLRKKWYLDNDEDYIFQEYLRLKEDYEEEEMDSFSRDFEKEMLVPPEGLNGYVDTLAKITKLKGEGLIRVQTNIRTNQLFKS